MSQLNKRELAQKAVEVHKDKYDKHISVNEMEEVIETLASTILEQLKRRNDVYIQTLGLIRIQAVKQTTGKIAPINRKGNIPDTRIVWQLIPSAGARKYVKD